MSTNTTGSGSAPEINKGPNFFNVLSVLFMLTFLINLLMFNTGGGGRFQITYSQFMNLVESGNVEQVLFDDSQLQISMRKNADVETIRRIIGSAATDIPALRLQSAICYTGRVEDPELVGMLRRNNVDFSSRVVRSSPILSFISSWVVPLFMMYLIYSLIFRGLAKRMGDGGPMSLMGDVGKSKAKVYSVEKNTGVTFKDVAGQDEAKESLTEMVDYLNHPDKYKRIGAKQPRGALLAGPPGTGKTLLARAVAGEAGVPFYHLSGSEFVEMFVGVGASRVRDLFQTAAKNAPCIVFIDEIDAIGKKRDNPMGGNDEREQTLNQLLAEMDGFESDKGILVLAATNRPEVLDPALMRPGRFDRRITVDKPDIAGREAILKVHSGKVTLSKDVDLRAVALATGGASGADLANMVNEAALRAVKEGRESVLQEDLMESVEVVIAGKEKKDRVLNPREREIVAFHEAGHALVSALSPNAQPVRKITIVPRTSGALGYTLNVPEEERYLMTKDELLDRISTLLGGRAAEMVQFGTRTTGASNDIERATQLARDMVTQYGMNDKFGPMGLESAGNRYLDGRPAATCSEQTTAIVDEEVRVLLDECQQRAVRLLENNRDALVRVSQHLLEKENISGEEFNNLLKEATANP